MEFLGEALKNKEKSGLSPRLVSMHYSQLSQCFVTITNVCTMCIWKSRHKNKYVYENIYVLGHLIVFSLVGYIAMIAQVYFYDLQEVIINQRLVVIGTYHLTITKDFYCSRQSYKV